MEHNDRTLRERITIRRCVEDPAGGAWSWEDWIPCAASVLPEDKRALYSPLAAGTRAVAVRLRHDPRLDFSRAIRWQGQLLLPVSIVPLDVRYDVARCAAVTAVPCRMAMETVEGGATFPGVVADKYVGHQQAEPMATKKTTRILTVPKPITLACGSLVEADGVLYTVLTDHVLGEGRNEYEIGRTEDL